MTATDAPDDRRQTRTARRQTRTARRQQMKAVSHTNPYTGESTGQLFNRGPIVAADGGRANAVDPEHADRTGEQQRMKDVSHTPPNESEDANRVFERGGSEDDVAVEYEE